MRDPDPDHDPDTDAVPGLLPSGRISKRATGPSRSQRRRDALDVLDLAKALMAARDGQLAKLVLDDDLAALIAQSRRVQQPIARKRQTQFLAKHLRRLDDDALAAIRGTLGQDRELVRRETALLHRLEAQREDLLARGDDALTALVQQHPGLDTGQVRQLIRQAQREQAQQRPPRASRELFRLLRGLAAADEADTADDDLDVDPDADAPEEADPDRDD